MTPAIWPTNTPAERAAAYQTAMDDLFQTVDGTVLHAGLEDGEIDALALTLYKWRNYRDERDKALALAQKQEHSPVFGIPDYPTFVATSWVKPKPVDPHVTAITTLLLP